MKDKLHRCGLAAVELSIRATSQRHSSASGHDLPGGCFLASQRSECPAGEVRRLEMPRGRSRRGSDSGGCRGSSPTRTCYVSVVANNHVVRGRQRDSHRVLPIRIVGARPCSAPGTDCGVRLTPAPKPVIPAPWIPTRPPTVRPPVARGTKRMRGSTRRRPTSHPQRRPMHRLPRSHPQRRPMHRLPRIHLRRRPMHGLPPNGATS